MGSRGYLGSYLAEKVSGACTDDNQKFAPEEYDFVINCIGRANLELCEIYPEVSYESNLNIVEKMCQKYYFSKVIHFSSYYVYDTADFATEKDKTTDKYVYCRHKLESEKIIRDYGGVTFRLGKLFGHPDYQKYHKLPECIIKNSRAGLDNVVFNPTSLEQVEKVVRWELSNKLLSGVYNLSNNGSTTHYLFGLEINKLMGGNKTIYRQDQDRIFHNYGRFAMNTSKLNSIIELTPWEYDLKKYIEKIK